ncbi:hypothetical protein DFH06DRAFT_624549 [Mycena polygramma]|nr:hypothetical protein DFH06DRAFT_624549 [Mycena polygramma]
MKAGQNQDHWSVFLRTGVQRWMGPVHVQRSCVYTDILRSVEAFCLGVCAKSGCWARCLCFLLCTFNRRIACKIVDRRQRVVAIRNCWQLKEPCREGKSLHSGKSDVSGPLKTLLKLLVLATESEVLKRYSKLLVLGVLKLLPKRKVLGTGFGRTETLSFRSRSGLSVSSRTARAVSGWPKLFPKRLVSGAVSVGLKLSPKLSILGIVSGL